jgi:hypothetical protein
MSDRVVPGAREALPDEVRAAMLAAGKESWADSYPRRGDEEQDSHLSPRPPLARGMSCRHMMVVEQIR